MKYSRKMRCISSALAIALAFMAFSFSFAPKAHAVQASVSVGYGFYGQWFYGNGSGQGAMTNYISSGTTPLINKKGYSFNMGLMRGDAIIYTSSNTSFSDIVKVYASYYYARGASTDWMTLSSNFYNTSTWECSYLNSNGVKGYLSDSLFKWEEVTGPSTSFNGKTYTIEAQFQGSEAYPISELMIRRPSATNGVVVNQSNATTLPYIYFPSIRIITTEYTAEMEALDNVANEIAAQSDILLAMKGDIVAILQDIYTMTGDMYIAQNLLNSYIAQMLPLIQSIDQTTTNIYALLSSQLAALETAINNSATTIEAAIEAQTAAMIAYLEELFNTGNEVPDETYEQQQDAENILDQMESLEKPDVETIVPEIDDYSDGGVSGVMSAIFSSNLIVTMMTLSASLAFGAYVLFGKRS